MFLPRPSSWQICFSQMKLQRGLLFFRRLFIRDFDLRTSSIAEAAGSVLKRSNLGPKPFHHIDGLTSIDHLLQPTEPTASTESCPAVPSVLGLAMVS
jgi:hypothetical protein